MEGVDQGRQRVRDKERRGLRPSPWKGTWGGVGDMEGDTFPSDVLPG